MARRLITALASIVLLTSGLTCTVQPPDMNGGDGGDQGGNGGGQGGDGGQGGGGQVDPGDLIGVLTANVSRVAGAVEMEDVVTVLALFATFDELSNNPDIDQNIIGDCTVTTVAIDDADSIDDRTVVDGLDAGASGTVDNGAATAMLENQGEGLYTPAGDLGRQGFAAGQTLTFDFPGGADVAAFMESIDLPSELTVTQPDLDDPNLTIENNAALPVSWTAGESSDSVNVVVSTSNITAFAVISCTFDDTGSATVPLEAMEYLADDSTATTVSVTRTNTDEVNVNMVAGGSGTVQITAQAGIARTIIPGLGGGGDDGIGGIDLCQLITCPEGQTCNPTTFLCE